MPFPFPWRLVASLLLTCTALITLLYLLSPTEGLSPPPSAPEAEAKKISPHFPTATLLPVESAPAYSRPDPKAWHDLEQMAERFSAVADGDPAFALALAAKEGALVSTTEPDGLSIRDQAAIDAIALSIYSSANLPDGADWNSLAPKISFMTFPDDMSTYLRALDLRDTDEQAAQAATLEFESAYALDIHLFLARQVNLLKSRKMRLDDWFAYRNASGHLMSNAISPVDGRCSGLMPASLGPRALAEGALGPRSDSSALSWRLALRAGPPPPSTGSPNPCNPYRREGLSWGPPPTVDP